MKKSDIPHDKLTKENGEKVDVRDYGLELHSNSWIAYYYKDYNLLVTYGSWGNKYYTVEETPDGKTIAKRIQG